MFLIIRANFTFLKLKNQLIEIYTDGSCSTQYKIGAWASIIFINDDKISIHGIANDTTNNRMELMAVIKSIEYIKKENLVNFRIIIYTDSQYVERIPERTEKFINSNFKTKKGTPIQNIDLVKTLIDHLDSVKVEFIKVQAHQKATVTLNYNREVDKLARKLLREQINN